MLIQRINNYQYNTNFGARLELRGDKTGIPKEVINKWNECAENIGSEDDLIIVNLNEEQTSEFYNPKHNLDYKTLYHSRNLEIITDVNNYQYSKTIPSYTLATYEEKSNGANLRPDQKRDNEFLTPQTRLSIMMETVSVCLDKLSIMMESVSVCLDKLSKGES